LSKTDAFFESIRTENIKTLTWSLRGGGFTPTKPFDNETQLPPIHLAVAERKLKSLKCMIELVDRMRKSEAELIDYREHERGMTPMMMAAAMGWKDGVMLLLQYEASLTMKCAEGLDTMGHAKKHKRKAIIQEIEEWTRDPADVVETEGMRMKREAVDLEKSRKAEASKQREEADRAAIAHKFDEKDRIEDAQKEASAMSTWDEVKAALDDMSTEVRVSREDMDAEDSNAASIDSTLWQIETLKILRLRLPKPVMTSLPADLGKLLNLTELIVSHNSLTTLPAEVGTLVHLKALEAEANCLETLPAELSNCTKLEVIQVTGNKLKSLAPLSTLVEMRMLYASNNELEALDFTIEVMSHLRVLAVSGNQLATLPAGVGELQQLIHLDASENVLTDLPAEMGNLSEKKLVEMELGGNKFKDRKIKQILEKSVKPVKELTAHLRKGAGGGGGGGGKGKKGKKKK